MRFGKKKCILFGLIGLLTFSAVACNNNTDVSKNNNSEISGKNESTPTPTETPTPTPTEKPRNPNPLNLGGYVSYKEEMPLDAAGNVRLLAGIDEKLKAGDVYISSFDVLGYNDGCILVKYLSAKNQEDFVEGFECKQHFALISMDSLEVVRDIEIAGSYYVQPYTNVIALEESRDENWTAKIYDYELNEIATVKTPSDTSGYLSSDGKRCYYAADKKLYVLNIENGITKEVALKQSFIIHHLNGIVSDDAGNDYAVIWGMAADYKEYYAILNATTGDVLYVYESGQSYCVMNNNTYVEFLFGDFFTDKWLAGVSKDKAFDYQWNGDSVEVSVYMMKNKDMLFSYLQDMRMYFFLYKYDTGELLASTSIDGTKMQPKGEINFDEFGGDIDPEGLLVYLYDSPIYVDKDTLLLHLGNYDNEHFFLEWNLGVDSSVVNHIEVKEHQMGSVPSVDISKMNNPLYIPGTLSDSLLPLRDRADEMEETYGVEIYIGEECSNILGNYSIKPLVDYALIEDSLDALEIEMEKYPDNFFEQFTYDWVEGLDIYLASTLTGISEEALDYAGGFKTIHDSKVLMVLDCTDTYSITSTFHHELSHVIEEKIVNQSYTQEKPVFNEEIWNGFNPHEDMYTYNYAENGQEDYWEYAYESVWWNGGDVENCYFVDSYAMTYPTEDRARLFESVMSEAIFDIDFENTPHLVEKLNYFAKCIRDAFDTTGWETVMWETYLK